MTERKTIELDIESIAFQGSSVAKLDGLVYFVKGGLPGDRVIAEIVRKRRNYAECVVKSFLEVSPHRVQPFCRHFGVCGGCSWQDLDYTEQTDWKRRHVMDSYSHIAKLEVGSFEQTMPSPQNYNYRNKMEFSFGASRWVTEDEILSGQLIDQKDFALGLHYPGRFDKVIDIMECHLQNQLGNRIINEIRKAALDFGTSAYNQRSHKGYLRNLILRYSRSTGEVMVILVTHDHDGTSSRNFISWFETRLTEIFKDISCLIHVINNTNSPVSYSQERIIKGEGFITDEILGIEFRISPFSFFQTNSAQLNKFIEKIIEEASLDSSDIVWDLYCGTGSITLPASLKCSKIYGLELSESSIQDAKANALRNGIKNTEFIASDLHAKTVPAVLESIDKPDVIFIDPPRAGMHKNLLGHIMTVPAKKIIYVSCNPTTQACDLEILSEDYVISKVIPVDMFPHTYHVEAIAVLLHK